MNQWTSKTLKSFFYVINFDLLINLLILFCKLNYSTIRHHYWSLIFYRKTLWDIAVEQFKENEKGSLLFNISYNYFIIIHLISAVLNLLVLPWTLFSIFPTFVNPQDLRLKSLIFIRISNWEYINLLTIYLKSILVFSF